MANGNQVLHTDQEPQEQEHLRGGQESADMAAFRERWHRDDLLLQLINMIGGLCTQQFLTNQSIESLISAIQEIGEESNNLSSLKMRAAFQQADDFHAVIYEGDAVNVDTSPLNEILNNALFDHDGDSIGNNIGAIRTDFSCACDPNAEEEFKVRIDGDIMSHPY